MPTQTAATVPDLRLSRLSRPQTILYKTFKVLNLSTPNFRMSYNTVQLLGSRCTPPTMIIARIVALLHITLILLWLVLGLPQGWAAKTAHGSLLLKPPRIFSRCHSLKRYRHLTTSTTRAQPSSMLHKAETGLALNPLSPSFPAYNPITSPISTVSFDQKSELPSPSQLRQSVAMFTSNDYAVPKKFANESRSRSNSLRPENGNFQPSRQRPPSELVPDVESQIEKLRPQMNMSMR